MAAGVETKCWLCARVLRDNELVLCSECASILRPKSPETPVDTK